MPASPPPKIQETLGKPQLQLAVYTNTGRLVEARRNAVRAEAFPDYQELRDHANAVKRHTIENLDYYLEQFEQNVTRRGGHVVFAETGEQVSHFILDLAKKRGSRLIVKSKSMASEEIHLNHHLEEHGLESVETDLGEYILQLNHETPYHIVAPAMHMTRYDVAEIFERELQEKETDPEQQARIARRVLREKFLRADIGISGGNFLVADSGAVLIVENEGNARLSTSVPRIHIAIVGIEKLIPRAQDLAVFLKLLGRSATGQALTSYTSLLNGPRRPGEVDGPEEFYVILLDNGRTRVLESEEKRQALYCIRCGACLNICPVFRKIGGHSYPWVYSGPIGAILTPQIHGVERDPWLPYASSLCGACHEVCPVKIDIPKVLLDLRQDVAQSPSGGGSQALGYRLFARLMSSPMLYRLVDRLRILARPVMGGGWVKSLPAFLNRGPLQGWLAYRDLPGLAPKSFRQQWRARQGGSR
ncbi:MAG: iron-sulfur cluster-binding protein [Acidobacteria bacterium]|nr:iron-sulfur cluster-binding protein [Acidobacteriota bacterium]